MSTILESVWVLEEENGGGSVEVFASRDLAAQHAKDKGYEWVSTRTSANGPQLETWKPENSFLPIDCLILYRTTLWHE